MQQIVLVILLFVLQKVCLSQQIYLPSSNEVTMLYNNGEIFMISFAPYKNNILAIPKNKTRFDSWQTYMSQFDLKNEGYKKLKTGYLKITFDSVKSEDWQNNGDITIEKISVAINESNTMKQINIKNEKVFKVYSKDQISDAWKTRFLATRIILTTDQNNTYLLKKP